MASLTGTKIKNTYDSLLKTTDNEPLDGTLRTITDGLGNNSSLSLSTGAADIGGTLSVQGATSLYSDLSVVGDYVSASGDITLANGDFIIGGTIYAASNIAHLGDTDTYINFDTNQTTVYTGGSARFNVSDSQTSVYNALYASSTLAVTGATTLSSLSSGDITLSGAIRNSANPLSTYLAFPTSTSFTLITNGSTKISASSGGVGLYGVISVGGTLVIDGDTWTNGKIMHTDDLNTYIDFPSNDNISFVTGGTQRLLVTNDEVNVTGNFEVNGSVISYSNANGKIVTNLSGGTENIMSSYVSSTDSDYEKLRISSEQFIVNTGSGTSSSQRLVINENGLATFANNVVIDGTLQVHSFALFDASVTADSIISTEGVYQAGSGAETGLIFPALDEISLKIDNTERLGLDSTGASVTGTLSVSGGITGTLSTAAQTNITSVGTLSSLNVSGSVGIGVVGAAAEKLHINSGSGNVQALFQSTDPIALITFDDSDTTFSTIGLGCSGDNIVFYQDTEKMRIDASGNVGIGVSPSAMSAVSGIELVQGSQISSRISANVPQLYISSNIAGDSYAPTYKVNGYAAQYRLQGYDGTHTWLGAPSGTAGASVTFTERMRITSGGYLKASSDGTYVDSTGNFHEITATTNVSNTVLARHKGTSPFGIEMAFTGATPNNTDNWFYYCQDSTALRFQVRSNGGVANYQANDVNLSDERVKTDISPLGSYWDKIKGIQIVNFKYKDQTHDDFNIGVIAQQVESIAPEFVDVDGFDNRPKVISEEVLDEEGNVIQEAVYEEPLAEPLKAVYTADLYHASIKVLQEAMAKIETLEAEVATLKSQING
jgi:hypothetical protein